MAFLNITASIKQRRPIASANVTEVTEIAPFSFGDSLLGIVSVVDETFDPNGPTTPVPLDSSRGIALTDGNGTVYSGAVILGVQNTNQIAFSIYVIGSALLTALEASPNGFINAFLEVRGTSAGQDMLILREQVSITLSATGEGTPIVASVPGLIVNPLIDRLRGAPTAIESIVTVGLPTLCFLIVNIGGMQMWQLVTGAADGTDPSGQVAPLDYNGTSNNRHWLKLV